MQNIAVIELLREKEYEEPVVNKTHLSTLIQQILSLVASFSGFYPKEGWEILCNRGAFRNITPKIFLDLLKCLGQKGILSQLNTGQIIVGKEGERLLRKLDFYTAFVAPVDYDVINNDDSKRIGMIQKIPEVKSQIILAGKRWNVERVDEKTKNIYVTRIKTGGAISFASDLPEIDEIITNKMREIYLSEDIYPYLDVASDTHTELIKAREYFKEKELDVKCYEGQTLFTWAGAKVNRTVALMCRLLLEKNLDYNHLMIHGIYLKDISYILSRPKVSGDELAALVPRFEKEKQKYDHFLSDELLNHEFANTYLDVDKAWMLLKEMADSHSNDYNNNNDNTIVMNKFDFRHIKDISNVVKYNTLTEPLNEVFKNYLDNSDLGCEIEVGAMFAGAPDHAMPINFLLCKGKKKVAILLMGFRRTKRYSVQETEALCKENGVNVLKFYFECENEESYVIERISKAFN